MQIYDLFLKVDEENQKMYPIIFDNVFLSKKMQHDSRHTAPSFQIIWEKKLFIYARLSEYSSITW